MASLTARNVHLTDQILAVLAAEGALPISTSALVAKLGELPYHAVVLRLLNRLARRGEVEKLELDGMRCLYWRRWPGSVLPGPARAAHLRGNPDE
jgi:hypothetical protein